MNNMYNTSVISKDIGGADILINYLNFKKITQCNYYLNGKAKLLFKKKLNVSSNSKLAQIYKYSKKIIISTGSSNFEKKIMFNCVKKKIYTIVILDHWINYKIRFSFENKLTIPDEIVVFDSLSKKMISKIFKNKCKITLIKNLHLIDLKRQFNHLVLNNNNNNNNNILILSEPLLETNSNNYKFNQFDGIKKILMHLKINKINYDSIVIRPHPREKLKNYFTFKSQNKIIVRNKTNLIYEIFNSKFIFGYNSIAFYFACILKKKSCFFIFNTNKFSSIYPIKNLKKI